METFKVTHYQGDTEIAFYFFKSDRALKDITEDEVVDHFGIELDIDYSMEYIEIEIFEPKDIL